jgi:D-serine deaminase-like pyridoxal phosphate-dependent protein
MLPDHPLPLPPPDAKVTGLWELHAGVDASATSPNSRPGVGDRIGVVPNHLSTAVNLAKELWVVSGEALVDWWELAASGANR